MLPIFLALLFDGLPNHIASAIKSSFGNPEFTQALAASGHLNAANPAAAQGYLSGLGGQLLNDSSFLSKLPPALALPFQEGFVAATHVVYILAGCLMVVALGVVLMIKATPLRTMSGLEERRLEDAAEAASAAGAENANGVHSAVPSLSKAEDGGSSLEPASINAASVDAASVGVASNGNSNGTSNGNGNGNGRAPAHTADAVVNPVAVADLLARTQVTPGASLLVLERAGGTRPDPRATEPSRPALRSESGPAILALQSITLP